jgi:hypothetical protein
VRSVGRWTIVASLAWLVWEASTLVAQQTSPASQPPVFRSSVNLVLVDVVVRDRSGAVAKGLTADDFELLEDGVRQQILTFAYDEVRADAPAVERATTLTGSTKVEAAASRRCRS